MKNCIAFLLFLVVGWASFAGAQTPQATDLPGSPFFIKKTWVIGGEGNWDRMTLDPKTLQLFIAHGRVVQVVDIGNGQVVGQVTGLRDAHGIALDDQGQFGYVSDGPADDVKVFDRSSFEVVTRVPTGRNPRSVVLDSSTGLVFVICPDTAPETPTPRNAGQPARGSSNSLVQSTVTVINAQTHKRLADILLPGRLGFAQGDANGTVYINVIDRNQIAYFHAQTIANVLLRVADRAAAGTGSAGAQPRNTQPDGPRPRSPDGEHVLTIDWTDRAQGDQPISRDLHIVNLGSGCLSPRSLAVDGSDQRLFVACENMRMQVMNAVDGSEVAVMPIGAGNDAIGYDADRGLIYASNGGGIGSLTIIRRDVSDTYHVIQELPTQARARTLAINPANGEVYLVTNLLGFDRNHNGGIGGLQTIPVAGSFQVLVVGN